MMKWKFVFLIITLLILMSGCNKRDEKVTDIPHKEETESVEEIEMQPEEEAKQETTETDSFADDEPIQTDKAESKKESEKDETKTQETPQKVQNPKPADKEQTPSKPSDNTEQNQTSTPSPKPVASYSPQTVVKLATEKTKARGKILLTENLDRLLAEGQITEDEYKEYYPYDGAGYYSVFVETDLNLAQTTSGRLLESVDGIAGYIAETLALEPGPYFLIEYAGVYTVSGTDFYEFRCYRA